ncbi:PPE family protein [Mycobacterium sp.]|uniref:PPE family protein n=1 Tax=Mycobacterium sp. TaxID=1785 RepID=UPI002BF2DEB8|nr:PPE family protein [Mycobacterium sp.]HTY31420.1 PPE family protein [Mycobacterium sp.]
MLDFAALPPEITSARIYAGPGSASLMAAASAWNAIAAELNSAALGYDRVVTTLSGEEWLGPTSASMAAAVQPYVEWMNRTGAQAEQAATQAQAAAAAYETALASVVPPPVITTNRAELAQATATNVLGQNNGIIAQLEAQYAEFWAQDAAAMYDYAASAARAAEVAPFSGAPQVANPAAQAAQTAVTSSGSTQSTLRQLVAGLPGQLQNLASPSSAASTAASMPVLTEIWFLLTGQTTLPTSIGSFLNGYSPYASFFYNTEGLPYFGIGMGNFGVQISKTLGWLGGAAAPAAAVPKSLPGLGGLAGGGAGPAAHLGSATSIGKLSVPATWATAAPTAGHAGTQLISAIRPTAETAGGPGNLLGGMPLAGTGSGNAGAAGPRYGFRPTVMARPPLGG